MRADRETKTILIIEDEHPARTMLALILENAGYRVLEAAHPNEAAHIWKRDRDQIDVIVANIWLPGISGPELANFFRRERPSVKTVFTTGVTADFRPDFSKLIRTAEIVRKPFTRDEVVGALQRVLSP